MGDRVAVMRKGELQQVADPQTLYDRPVNLFVGGFIGSPAMNMVEATLERRNGDVVVHVGEQAVTLDADVLETHPALHDYDGRTIVLGIRPEDLEDAALMRDYPAERKVMGHVELTEALGSEIMVHFGVKAKLAMTEDVRELAQDVGDERAVQELDEEDAQPTSTIVGRFSPRSRVRAGEDIEVAIDTRTLHFFDPETGLGIYDGTTKGEQHDP